MRAFRCTVLFIYKCPRSYVNSASFGLLFDFQCKVHCASASIQNRFNDIIRRVVRCL